VSAATLLEISDNSANNRIAVYYSAGGIYCEVVRAGGAPTIKAAWRFARPQPSERGFRRVDIPG
jgi:hypothetical protein